MKVVESHNLLGEIQNGFRPNRSCADNNFILGSIKWKAAAKRLKVHAAYIDVSKAYDSVDRGILWRKLSSLGIGGTFLATLKSLYLDDSIDCNVNGIITRSIFLRRGLRQGCSLSPVLFALYISEVGIDIVLSKLGFSLGNVCISGLLFADDLVLIARTAQGLKTLLELVKNRFDELKLTINCKKSQVISPEDHDWVIDDELTGEFLILEKVCAYKYLGIWSYSSMFKTCSERQKYCIRTAYNYKNACIYVSKYGPDIVDVILCTWLNIAIPAILTGCESIVFTDTTIDEIDKIQSQVAKFALGVPINTPNICAQTELGMRTFRHQLFQRQLSYYFRILYLPSTRWVHQALLDHLEGGWDSPYLRYIASLRRLVGMFSAPSLTLSVKGICNEYFLGHVNGVLESHEYIPQLKTFSRQKYVTENKMTSVIATFKLANEGFGNKHPIHGYARRKFCALCPGEIPISGPHVIFFCKSLEMVRCETGIISFLNDCTSQGLSWKRAYLMYINGLSPADKHLSVREYYERAKVIDLMRNLWLSSLE